MLRRRLPLWGALLGLGLGLALAAGLWLPRETPPSIGASDQALLRESLEVQTTRHAAGADQAAPPPSGERSTIGESLQFIVRDASGTIKESSSVGGK